MKPASPKQIAFLAYFGRTVAASASSEEASLEIDNVCADLSLAELRDRWFIHRFWLHPDLYVTERESYRKNRLNSFFTEARGEELKYRIRNLTKAQAKAVLDELDATSPEWDLDRFTAFYDHFLPLLELRFPETHK